MTRRPVEQIVADLRLWGSLKPGDHAPPNQWGPPLTALLNEAADALDLMRVLLGVALCSMMFIGLVFILTKVVP